MKFEAHAVEDLKPIAEAIEKLCKTHTVFALDAPMGSGKTTFVSSFLKQIGVTDEVSSPTYGYVKSYASEIGEVHHFDVYRLEDEMEAYDLGIEEYLDSGNICLIEWPEKIENLLPQNTVWVKIRVGENQVRTFEIEL